MTWGAGKGRSTHLMMAGGRRRMYRRKKPSKAMVLRRGRGRSRGGSFYDDFKKGYNMVWDDWVLPLSGVLGGRKRGGSFGASRRRRGRGETHYYLSPDGYSVQSLGKRSEPDSAKFDKVSYHYQGFVKTPATMKDAMKKWKKNVKASWNKSVSRHPGKGRRGRGEDELPRYLPGLSRADQAERYYQLFGPPEGGMEGDGRRRRRKGGSFGAGRGKKGGMIMAPDNLPPVDFSWLSRLQRPGGMGRRRGKRGGSYRDAVKGYHEGLDFLSRPVRFAKDIIGGVLPFLGLGKGRKRGGRVPFGSEYWAKWKRAFGGKGRGRGGNSLKVRGPGPLGRFTNFMRSGPIKHRIFKTLPVKLKSAIKNLGNRGYGGSFAAGRRRRPHRRIRSRRGGARYTPTSGYYKIASHIPRTASQALTDYYAQHSKFPPDHHKARHGNSYMNMFKKLPITIGQPGRVGRFINSLKQNHYYWYKKAPGFLKNIGKAIAKRGWGGQVRRGRKKKAITDVKHLVRLIKTVHRYQKRQKKGGSLGKKHPGKYSNSEKQYTNYTPKTDTKPRGQAFEELAGNNGSSLPSMKTIKTVAGIIGATLPFVDAGLRYIKPASRLAAKWGPKAKPSRWYNTPNWIKKATQGAVNFGYGKGGAKSAASNRHRGVDLNALEELGHSILGTHRLSSAQSRKDAINAGRRATEYQYNKGVHFYNPDIAGYSDTIDEISSDDPRGAGRRKRRPKRRMQGGKYKWLEDDELIDSGFQHIPYGTTDAARQNAMNVGKKIVDEMIRHGYYGIRPTSGLGRRRKTGRRGRGPLTGSPPPLLKTDRILPRPGMLNRQLSERLNKQKQASLSQPESYSKLRGPGHYIKKFFKRITGRGTTFHDALNRKNKKQLGPVGRFRKHLIKTHPNLYSKIPILMRALGRHLSNRGYGRRGGALFDNRPNMRKKQHADFDKLGPVGKVRYAVKRSNPDLYYRVPSPIRTAVKALSRRGWGHQRRYRKLRR